jgi:putative endonuclease
MGINMAFFAYMIKSESTGKHYYGHTSDIEQRLESHNSTQNKYTRGKGPWTLVGFVEADTKGEAMKLENKLKKMKSPKRAKSWLNRSGSVR